MTEAPSLAAYAAGGRAIWIRADDGVRLRAMVWAAKARPDLGPEPRRKDRPGPGPEPAPDLGTGLPPKPSPDYGREPGPAHGPDVHPEYGPDLRPEPDDGRRTLGQALGPVRHPKRGPAHGPAPDPAHQPIHNPPVPRGTVLILQGRTEWCEKFAPAAAALNAAGFTAAALDFRGQGFSDRLLPDRRLGHVAAIGDYQRDLAALLDLVAEQSLPQPLFLLSHSMGGAIALRALHLGLKVAAAAFSAPMWGIRIPLHLRPVRVPLSGWYRRRGLMLSPAPTTRALPYSLRKPFPGNRLTRDPQQWQLMREQLLHAPELQVGGPTMHWLHEAMLECAALRALPPPPVPALIAWGQYERTADRFAMARLAARWPGARRLVYPGARHEVLMELPDVRNHFLAACTELFTQSCPTEPAPQPADEIPGAQPRSLHPGSLRNP